MRERGGWRWSRAWLLALGIGLGLWRLSFALGLQSQRVTLIVEKPKDVREVLTTLAAAAGVKMVIAPEVRGLITVRIENRPFEEALNLIATVRNLEWRREGEVYHIEPRREEKPREMVVYLQHLNAEEVARALGYVDLGTLDKPIPLALPSLLPKGMVEPPQPRPGNALLLRGTPSALRALQQMLLQMDTPLAPVALDVLLVQCPLSQASKLRLRWQEQPKEVFQAGESPQPLPFVVRSPKEWLTAFLKGAGVTVLLQSRLLTQERRPAWLRLEEGPRLSLGWVVAVLEGGKSQNWVKIALSFPKEGKEVPWEIVVDGILVPPEEVLLLWLSREFPPSPALEKEGEVLLLLLKPQLLEDSPKRP